MDYLAPLATNAVLSDDLSESERLMAIDADIQRNKAIDQMLRGELSPDDLLDVIAYHEVDPMEYAHAATIAINQAIHHGVILELWQ